MRESSYCFQQVLAIAIIIIIIIIINDIYMAQVRRKEMQQMRQVNCYTLSAASVMKNVLSVRLSVRPSVRHTGGSVKNGAS